MSETKQKPTLEELLMLQNELALEDMKIKREQKVETDAEKKAAKEVYAHKLAVKLEREARTQEKFDRTASRCKHERGDGSFKKSPIPESNLYMHQLPTGEFFIGCLSRCHFKWFQNDTREFLMPNPLRGNKKPLPNPTGMSFQDAYARITDAAMSRSDVMFVPPVSAPVAA